MGFNELANGWHTDIVHKHGPDASECFLLTAFLAFNTFHAFFALNLKLEIRGQNPGFPVPVYGCGAYSGAERRGEALSTSAGGRR